MKNILSWISAAYAVAWMIVVAVEPALWPVATLGFVQNIAFTFVSRGRNSGSLGYHLLASIFSNGIYAALLFTSIDMISQAKSNPGPFLLVYTLATMSGSIFAHWLALRLEKGKARSVQEDKFAALSKRVQQLEANVGRPYSEVLHELELSNGVRVRVWGDMDNAVSIMARVDGLLKDQTIFSESEAEMARIICERSEANAVQVSLAFKKSGGDSITYYAGTRGVVYYREWP